VTGNPDPFEQPPQQVTASQRDPDEDEADGQMLRKPCLDPEPWKNDNLRGDGQNIADDHVCRGLDK
jgi:hypothetical protein